VHGSPGNTGSQGNTKTPQGNTPKKSFWARLQDFMTGTSGLITSIAAIVVAISTIVGVLVHGSGQRSPTAPTITAQGVTAATTRQASAPHVQGTSSTPSQTTTAPPTAAARVQWGPGSLVISNDGTLLSGVPPISDTSNASTVGDVYSGGNSIQPFAGTTLALWTSGGQPTAQQCANLVTTQADGSGVNVVPGSVVCVVTGEGPIAIIDVTSFSSDGISIETKTTVWDLPGA
jgi:hypothetical protein